MRELMIEELESRQTRASMEAFEYSALSGGRLLSGTDCRLPAKWRRLLQPSIVPPIRSCAGARCACRMVGGQSASRPNPPAHASRGHEKSLARGRRGRPVACVARGGSTTGLQGLGPYRPSAVVIPRLCGIRSQPILGQTNKARKTTIRTAKVCQRRSSTKSTSRSGCRRLSSSRTEAIAHAVRNSLCEDETL